MTPNKTVAFHTFGCKVNQYETEELRGQLALGGFRVVPFEESADVYLINSCSVTADADSSCRQLVRKVLREHPEARLVVTGCYAERAPDELRALSPRLEVFGNHEKPMLATALGVPTACVETAAQQGVTALADRTRAYIKVQDGCDALCTYCIIPSVRPTLICRSPDLIRKEAQQLLLKGFREIVLTGVRLGRYDFQEADARWDLGHLVKSLINLPGDFRLRLSSIEVTEIPESIVDLAATNPKLCPFFHIPLQSGDDVILKRMGRWYTSSDYRHRLAQIRRRIPRVAFSADVIVGFAGETEERFQNTATLLSEEGFSRAHVFRYSIRPGTPAERLPGHVEGRIKSDRTRRLVKLDFELRRRYAEQFIGRSVRVLQENAGVGYSEHYVRVRSVTDHPEGHFYEAVGRDVSADGQLVA